MALKKRTSPPPSSSGGATALPSFMVGLPETRMLESLPLDGLTPAPDDWNFYAPLPDGKFIELLESIQANGLLHPIVVWKQPGGGLMILSGHNRVRAYKALYEKTGENKYRTIPATVLTDLSESEAHEIVVDSNFVQRNLTPSERAKSIYQKYVLAGRKKRSKNGERRSNYDIIAEQYQLSSRQIARYVKLGTLPDCLQVLLDSEQLPIATALKLIDFPFASQQHLADRWADELRSKQLDRLRPEMTLDQIDEVMSGRVATARVTVTVPLELEKEFRAMVSAWLRAHGTED